jgi:hypothetical protein
MRVPSYTTDESSLENKAPDPNNSTTRGYSLTAFCVPLLPDPKIVKWRPNSLGFWKELWMRSDLHAPVQHMPRVRKESRDLRHRDCFTPPVITLGSEQAPNNDDASSERKRAVSFCRKYRIIFASALLHNSGRFFAYNWPPKADIDQYAKQALCKTAKAWVAGKSQTAGKAILRHTPCGFGRLRAASSWPLSKATPTGRAAVKN